MRLFIIVLVYLMPTVLWGETFPALYSISNVDEKQAREIREAPDSAATIIAELESDITDFEVVALDDTGNWGWVNTSSQSGWVAMKFLERQTVAEDNQLPRPLVCFGTDPFWNMEIDNRTVVELGLLDETPIRFFELTVTPSVNSADHFALTAETRDRNMHAMVQRQICTHGELSRIYGLSMSVIVKDAVGPQVYSGCCSIAR